jgi:hypothetical protein
LLVGLGVACSTNGSSLQVSSGRGGVGAGQKDGPGADASAGSSDGDASLADGFSSVDVPVALGPDAHVDEHTNAFEVNPAGGYGGTVDSGPISRGGAFGVGGSAGYAGSGGSVVDASADENERPDVLDAKGVADVPADALAGPDSGGVPICLSILSLGQPAELVSGTGTADAFQRYINTYSTDPGSGATSVMTVVTKQVPISDGLLKGYNVLILQALEDSAYAGLWTFTQSETDALARWVSNGGSLITMAGYGGNSSEIQPLNQLLGGANAWSGISYNADDIFTSCPDNLCYCSDSSIPFAGWQDDYADFNRLTHHLAKVGIFHGRSINCAGSDCQFFAKDDSGHNVGIAKKLGKGHLVAWADEWVTHTSEWGLYSSPWDTYPECANAARTARLMFSVPQFWYNIFYWSVPDKQWCFILTIPPDANPSQMIAL